MNCIKLYRISRFFYEKKLTILAKLIYNVKFILFNSQIPYTAEIASGTRCSHAGIGVVIHKNSKIGHNVVLGQGITIGGNFGKEVGTIGDNVFIAAGARILGANIGSNVIIGANAVITRDVPNNVVVVGNPAKITHKIILKEDGDIVNATRVKIKVSEEL